MDAGQQQLAEGGLPDQGRFGKELQGATAQGFGFFEAAILVEDEGLVKIDDGDPGVVVLLFEKIAGVAEEVEREGGIAMVAGGDGDVGHGLRHFIAHAQLAKGFRRHAWPGSRLPR